MFLTTLTFRLTFEDFVVVKVVLFFFPAVTILASVFKLTPVRVCLSLLLGAPELALILATVLVYVGLPSEVLPVVRVDTLVPEVVFALLIEGAPYCLKVEHVEVCISFHVVQFVNAQFIL